MRAIPNGTSAGTDPLRRVDREAPTVALGADQSEHSADRFDPASTGNSSKRSTSIFPPWAKLFRQATLSVSAVILGAGLILNPVMAGMAPKAHPAEETARARSKATSPWQIDAAYCKAERAEAKAAKRAGKRFDWTVLSRASLQPLVQQAAAEQAKHGVTEDEIFKLIELESSFRPCVVSPKGAAGLMQIMPETAREELGLTLDQRFVPADAIPAGAEYLGRQHKNFGSKDLGNAAYNAGPGAVDKAGKSQRHQAKIPGNRETRRYVEKMARARSELGPEKQRSRLRTKPHKPLVAQSKAKPNG